MKSIRGKILALLGAGMVFQVGGCTITDALAQAVSGAIPDAFSRLLGM